MSAPDTITLIIRRAFAFPAERVFDAWLNPALAREFLYTTTDGEVIRCDIDARPGGRYTIVDRRPNGEEILHTGIYREIARPHRLVFTLQVPQYAPEEDEVVIEITPLTHGCELVLRTAVLKSVLAVVSQEQMEEGWTMILGGLARELASHPTGAHS